MSSCKSVTTPMCEGALRDISNIKCQPADRGVYQELISCLLFIATRTRPEITASVSIHCRYASSPNQILWMCLKRILHYLQGTRDFSLRIFVDGDSVLSACCDSDWAGDRVDRRSTTGVLLPLGRTTVTWKTVKQTAVALSTTEAEFLSLSEEVKLVLWQGCLLRELDCEQDPCTKVIEDNQGAAVWGAEGV